MLLFSSIGTWSVNRGFNTTNLGAKLQPPFVDALISQENRASFLLCSCVWYIEGIYTSDPLIRVCIFGKDFPSFSCISNFVVSINEFLLWIEKNGQLYYLSLQLEMQSCQICGVVLWSWFCRRPV